MASDPSYTFAGKNESASDPADDYVVVTPSGTPLANGPCKAILCDSDGALNLTVPKGNAVRQSIPVVKGYNPLRASVINAPTAGAAPTKVVALY